MVDLSRRGLVQALTAAAGLLTTPGAAAAKAAMSIAEAPGFGAVAALTGAGSAPDCSPRTGGSQRSLATQAAIQILERKVWHHGDTPIVRASIDCFRSASRVNKIRWEEEAKDDDVDVHLKYRQVLDWLQEGTIKL